MAMLARRPLGGKHGRFAAAAALAAVLLCTPAAAQQVNCPASRTPIKLNFNTMAGAAAYSHGVSLSGIGKLAREGVAPMGDGSRPVGLTTVNALFNLQGGSTLVKRGAAYCSYLTSVEIEFGWDRMQVYVPSEYPQGSCEYRAVIDHENQHVSIYRSALKEFAPRARARIEAVLARARPTVARDQNGGMDAALAPVSAELSALLKEFINTHAARHQQIDTPSNYAAVTALCKNWDGAQK